MIRVWIDDIHTPPFDEWIWIKTVYDAQNFIKANRHSNILLSMDHDAGDYAKDGGDYIKLLDWLEEQGIVDTGYFFHIHSFNPVGVENMRRIIQKNGWREIRYV